MRFQVTARDPLSGRCKDRTVQAQNVVHAENLVARAGLEVVRVRRLDLPIWRRFGPPGRVGLTIGGALGLILLLSGVLTRPAREVPPPAEGEEERSANNERRERTASAARFLAAAQEALAAGEIEQALAKAREASQLGLGPAAIEAAELVRTIELPMAPETLARELAALDDKAFVSFGNGGELPRTLGTGFEVLDVRRMQNARQQVRAAASRRARDPERILEKLRRVGLWPSSEWSGAPTGGAFSARSTAQRGENTIVCELSSNGEELVEIVRIELQMLDPYDSEDAALQLFTDAVGTFCGSSELAAAIHAARPWHGQGWHLICKPTGYATYSLVFSNL